MGGRVVSGLPPPTGAAQGLDVSHWQGAIDWVKVRASGRSFVYTKATEGTGFVDSAFRANFAGARAAGLLRGAYHFFRCNVDPIAQADFFLATLGGDLGDLPPCVDVETTDGMGWAAIAARVKAFCERVAASSGRRPVVYTGPGFFDSCPEVGLASMSDVWVAHWTTGAPRVPKAWPSWRFWQNNNKTSVPGVPGACDVDFFFGTEAELRDFAHAPPAPPGPAPAPSPSPAPGPTPAPTPAPVDGALYTWGVFDKVHPDNAPAYIGARAVELLHDGHPLGVEHVEEHEGRIWKFRHETHGANAQIPTPHPGVGAKVLVPSPSLVPGSLDEARALTADLSDAFFAALAARGAELGEDPAHFLLVMCAESGIAPWLVAKNGAAGLNMTIPLVLKANGLTTAQWAALPAEGQLPLCVKLWKMAGAPFSSAARLAWANLYPATMVRGDGDGAVVMAAKAADANERGAYASNAALDFGKDGLITQGDLGTWLDSVAKRPRYQLALRRLRAAQGGQGPHGAAPGGGADLLVVCAALAALMVV